MKKGFTLVELLAVIIILGVLSILIVPKVINTLNDSEEKTNMASAEGLLKAAEYKYKDNEIKGISENITIDYTTGTNTGLLDFNGKKPEKGKVNIRSNGKIAFAVKIGENCYFKSYNEREITSAPYNEETCDNNTSIIQNYEIPETVILGDGLYESTTEPGRLIYRGTNPNNYMWLDENGDSIKTVEETYRVISYETDGTIKVVRNNDILDNTSSMRWDNTRVTATQGYYCTGPGGCNVWGNQNNTYFNGELMGDNFHYSYYSNPTTETLTSGQTGKVTEDASLNIYLNSKNESGWQPSIILDNYIETHSFKVGGIYESDAGDKGIIKEKEEEGLLTWNGKIALMNLTEYMEASTNPNCTSIYSNYFGNSNHVGWPCKESNWTHKDYNEWTLTPVPNGVAYSDIWNVWANGFYSAHGNMNSSHVGIRPAFYLKSSVKLGGTGTEYDSYYIAE